MEKPYTSKEWLREQYHEKGLNQREMADECGVGQDTISYHMRKQGVETTPTEHINVDLNKGKKYANKEWLRKQYVDKRKTAKEIAKVCGVSTTTILDWLDRHGIETRDQSEAQRSEGKHNNENWLREQYIENRRSMSDIASELGMSASGIKKCLHRYDIPTRNSYEHTRYEPASFGTAKNGYEYCRSKHDYTQHSVTVHQLVAIAEGVNPHKVFSNGRYHIHHENRIRWDNRPENLSLKSGDVHTREHQVSEERHVPVEYETDRNKEQLLSDLRNLVVDWNELDNSAVQMCADELDGLLKGE
jgi:transposase